MTNGDNERMARLEEKVDNIDKNFTDFKNDFKEFLIKHEQQDKNFKEFCDRKYANKTVEKIVYGLVGIILSVVVYALVNMVVI
jgi:t-SNARE complex subunit (syntaxin)